MKVSRFFYFSLLFYKIIKSTVFFVRLNLWKIKRDGSHLHYRGSSFVLLNVPIITIVHGKTANLAFYQKKRGLTFRHFNLEVIPFYVFWLFRDKIRPLLFWCWHLYSYASFRMQNLKVQHLLETMKLNI